LKGIQKPRINKGNVTTCRVFSQKIGALGGKLPQPNAARGGYPQRIEKDEADMEKHKSLRGKFPSDAGEGIGKVIGRKRGKKKAE